MFGSEYIFQSLPRLLTLWLEYGEKVHEGAGTKCDKTLASLNREIDHFTQTLPAYQFYTSFSQLVSRICHPNEQVFAYLMAILIKIINEYPQQSLWSLLAVKNSRNKERKSKCASILQKVRKHSQLIATMGLLAECFIELCELDIPPPQMQFSLDKKLRRLRRMTPLPIIVPLQNSLACILPASHQPTESDYACFPDHLPLIHAFEDTVECMASLQRPRKFFIVGNDGRKYPFLAKPKDDLRKDNRVMEFSCMINRLLKADPKSRSHQLHIRTYSVVPLTEDCGLIEWISNMLGLRYILNQKYKQMGIFMSGKEIMKVLNSKAYPEGTSQRTIFEKHLLPCFPPVFADWFLDTFLDPISWYSSRISYSSTLAVMSIVGYIVGLGDRHGENILFDSTTGECMHVDLNCLFNKGETFDIPEVVPFRLTHNMTDALGLTGYEGLFRKTCQVTLRVLRSECDSLMSVLKPFIHDPLLDWTKSQKHNSATEPERQAAKVVSDIEKRLKGKQKNSLPISIEGQVHGLIQEATNIDNLCRMYVGWGPYL
eukprot:Sdes_comp20982_c0_seq10m19359